MLNQSPARGFVRVLLVLYNGSDTWKKENQRITRFHKGLSVYCRGATSIPSVGSMSAMNDGPKFQEFIKAEHGTFASRF